MTQHSVKIFTAIFCIIAMAGGLCAAEPLDPSARATLQGFAEKRGSYAITAYDGPVKVRRHGKKTFEDVRQTPFTIASDDEIVVSPISTVEIALDRATRIRVENEAVFRLDQVFSLEKVSALEQEVIVPDVTVITVGTKPPSVYEQRTYEPGSTRIDVFEGKVYIAELDMYGSRVKKEMLLEAGESVTVSGVDSGDSASSSASSTSPPSPTPSSQPTPSPSSEKSWMWATTYDSTYGNTMNAVCADSNNNIIVAGVTIESGGLADYITLLKYDTNGNLLWNKTYNPVGLTFDVGCGVVADSQNNIIVGGEYQGGIYIILKYDSSGNLLPGWPVLYDPGLLNSRIYDVAVDTNDSIVVTGSLGDDDVICTRKYDSSGTLQWDKQYPAAPDPLKNYRGASIAVDTSDNSIVVNGFIDYSAGATGDMVTIKYDSSGNVAAGWPQTDHIAGSTDERGQGVTVDASGNVYAGGTYRLPSADKGILVKYDKNGAVLWRKYPIGDRILKNPVVSGGAIIVATDEKYGMIRFTEADDAVQWSGSYSEVTDKIATSSTMDHNGCAIVTGYTAVGGKNIALTVKYNTLSGTSTLTKTVNRKETVIGDILTYTLTLHNPKAETLAGVTLTDRLPPGFTYVRRSSVYGGAGISDPSGARTLTYHLGELAANARKTLSYQLIVGAGCIPGDYDNEANASGTYSGGTYTFNTTHAIVKVVLDPILQKGTIVGTVYWDHNENGIQEKGEEGIQGVKVYLEDGTSVATDKYGRYHFQGVNPGTHTVKIDKSTIKERS